MNNEIYNILLHVHSVGRWIILILLLIAIFNSMVAGSRPFARSDNRTGLLLTIFTDLQLLIGIAMWYFGSKGFKLIEAAGGMGEAMKEPTTRFFAVEHIAGMLIAVILIHIGKAQAKRRIGDRAKHRNTLIFYLIALLVILLSIPWPFRSIGAASGWF